MASNTTRITKLESYRTAFTSRLEEVFGRLRKLEESDHNQVMAKNDLWAKIDELAMKDSTAQRRLDTLEATISSMRMLSRQKVAVRNRRVEERMEALETTPPSPQPVDKPVDKFYIVFSKANSYGMWAPTSFHRTKESAENRLDEPYKGHRRIIEVDFEVDVDTSVDDSVLDFEELKFGYGFPYDCDLDAFELAKWLRALASESYDFARFVGEGRKEAEIYRRRFLAAAEAVEDHY